MALRLCLLLLCLSFLGCGDNKKVRIAFVSNNPADFWKLAEAGCRKFEAEQQDTRVEVRKPDGTYADQKRKIEDLVSRGIQGIAISPNDAANSGPFIASVNEKIYVITQDSDIPDPKGRRLYLGTHNYRAGRAAGQLVKEALPQGGKIAIFVGDLAVQNAYERRQGVIDELIGIDRQEIGEKTDFGATNLPLGDKYILVATKTEGGAKPDVCKKSAEDLLTKEPLDAMVGLWAYNPPALLQAKRNVKAKAVIIGFDEDLPTLEAILAGEIYGTVVQNPVQFGYLSSKFLHGLVTKDDSFIKSQPFDEHMRLYIPHRIFKNDGSGEEKRKVAEFFAETKKHLGK